MSVAARSALKSAVAEAAPALVRLRGLYMGGSFGRGIADDLSDLDYVAVAEPDDMAGLVEDWVGMIAQFGTIVHRMQRVFPTSALVNLISADWVRCDLLIETENRFSDRAKDRLAVIFERTPFFDRLAEQTKLPPVNPVVLSAAVEEFLRVLGLAHLAVGRGDHFTAQWGVALLRDQVRVFVSALEPGVALSGALTLSRELSAQRMAVLEGLPVGGIDMATTLNAQQELARRFLPMAKAACAANGASWPSPFVAATSRVLRGTISNDFCNWLAGQA